MPNSGEPFKELAEQVAARVPSYAKHISEHVDIEQKKVKQLDPDCRHCRVYLG